VSEIEKQKPTEVAKNQRHSQTNTINRKNTNVLSENQANLAAPAETRVDDDDLVKEVLAEVSVRDKGIRDEWLTKEGIGRKEYVCRKNDKKCRQRNKRSRSHSNHKNLYQQKNKRNKHSRKPTRKHKYNRNERQSRQNDKKKWNSNKRRHERQHVQRHSKRHDSRMPRKVAKALKTIHGFSNDNGISEWHLYGR